MNTKQIIDILFPYIPDHWRKYVPLAGVAAILLLMLVGRYLPPETVAEVKDAIQTAIAAPSPAGTP